jgi:hypothetical protein
MKDIDTGESAFTRLEEGEATNTIPSDNKITHHVKTSFADPTTGRGIIGQVVDLGIGWFCLTLGDEEWLETGREVQGRQQKEMDEKKSLGARRGAG